MGASATSAAKKNATPLSMSSDEEAHQGEEHFRVVTYHVTPPEDPILNTLKTPMKFYLVMNWLAISRQASEGVIIQILVNDRLAHFTDKDGDCVGWNAPPKLHVSILRSRGQMSQCHSKFQARFDGMRGKMCASSSICL